jgi:flagellar hook-length control protein FliK
MKVVKAGPTDDQQTAKTQTKTEKSSSFAKTLNEKRKTSPAPAMPANGLADGNAAATPTPIANEASKGVTTPPPDIDHLVNEIVDHIGSYRSGETQHLDIEFKSQVLGGLGVHVQKEHGTVAVSFVTRADGAAALLNQHLDSLRSALEDKGVRVASLKVSSGTAGAVNRNRLRQ